MYQEQGIRHKGIREDGPAGPAARAGAAVQRLGHDERDDDADELVTRVRDEVEQLAVVADAQDVGAELEAEDLEQDDDEGGRGRQAHDFRVEAPPQAGEQRREQDVRHECHDGDVHVRGVEVVARRQVVVV